MTAYVSGSGANTGSGTSTSINIAAPASIAAGNLLIAILFNGDTGTAPSYTTPSGWTQVGSRARVQFAGAAAVYTKTATASEATSYAFSAGTYFFSGVVLQYSGTSGLDGVPVFSTTTQLSLTSAAQTAGAGDGKVLAFGSNGGGVWTTPTGTTARASTRSSTNTSLYTFDALTSPAESYTSTNASTGGVAVSLLLAPAAAATLTWSIWTGTAETPATLDGVWNGSTTVPGTASRY